MRVIDKCIRVKDNSNLLTVSFFLCETVSVFFTWCNMTEVSHPFSDETR